MNKFQKLLLEKCKTIKVDDDVRLLDEIYILPTTRKHDSGYKIMYIVGKSQKENEYYLLDTYCDVVNFGWFKTKIEELNIDILDNGIIHLWSNKQLFKSTFRVSSCVFETVDRENTLWR